MHGAFQMGRFVDALKARKKGGGPPEQALKFFDSSTGLKVRLETKLQMPEGRRPPASAASASNTASPS